MLAEDYVVVLDFLPRGTGTGFKAEPMAQVMGTEHFTLLEIIPKPGTALKIAEKLYVGKEDRDKVDHIKRRVSYKDLTNTAASELEKAVEKLVTESETRFVGFYNDSRPITIKRHQLELLPGLGKKHMLNILNTREKQKFSSYKDLEERVALMPDPAKLIAKRIMDELQGRDAKHYIFTRPPSKRSEFPPRERRREEHGGARGRAQHGR